MRDGVVMRRLLRLAPLLLALAGCAPPPPPAKPAPPPPPAPPRPIEPPAPETWQDRPETPGNWAYAHDATGSSATYGGANAPLFRLGCDKASRRVSLTRIGGPTGALKIETSYSAMSWPAQTASDGATVTLGARDPFLDKIAFSRGRFTVTMGGLPDLILPAWAEPSRVIEDCRS